MEAVKNTTAMLKKLMNEPVNQAEFRLLVLLMGFAQGLLILSLVTAWGRIQNVETIAKIHSFNQQSIIEFLMDPTHKEIEVGGVVEIPR